MDQLRKDGAPGRERDFTMFRGVGLDLATVPPLHGRRSRGANGGKIGHSGRDDRKRRGGWREPAPLKTIRMRHPAQDPPLHEPTAQGWGTRRRTRFSQCFAELAWILPRSLRFMADVRAARTGKKSAIPVGMTEGKRGTNYRAPATAEVTQEGGVKPPLRRQTQEGGVNPAPTKAGMPQEGGINPPLHGQED